MKALIIPFTLLFGLASACKAGDARKPISNYPPAIDSLHLNKLYDDTKWLLYLLHCDDTPRSGSRNTFLFLPPKPFASMELRFDSLLNAGDSVCLYFDFYQGDTLINCVTFPDIRNHLIHGMAFTKAKGSGPIYLLSCSDNISNAYYFGYPKEYLDTTSDRRLRPLQPHVVKFINKHQSELNLWFLEEAKKRGVIK